MSEPQTPLSPKSNNIPNFACVLVFLDNPHALQTSYVNLPRTYDFCVTSSTMPVISAQSASGAPVLPSDLVSLSFSTFGRRTGEQKSG